MYVTTFYENCTIYTILNPDVFHFKAPSKTLDTSIMLFYTCIYTSWPWGGQRFPRDGPEPNVKRNQILGKAEGGCGAWWQEITGNTRASCLQAAVKVHEKRNQ